MAKRLEMTESRDTVFDSFSERPHGKEVIIDERIGSNAGKMHARGTMAVETERMLPRAY